MPFSRPTLTDIRQQVAQDVASAVDGGANLLRRSVLGVLGAAQAGLAHLHYGYLDWIAKQAVPFTCTDEALEGWAALKGVTRKPAAAATGIVTFAGAVGAVIPSGTAIARAADGRAFTSTQTVAVGGAGTASVPVRADEPGAGGNTDAGAAFALSQAVSGVPSSGTSGALIGGADVEADEELRTRMLTAYQITAMGGAHDDFVSWALAVPGVTRSWCVRNGAGLGTVVLFVMFDDAQAAHGGFPQGSDGVASAETRAQPATGDQLTVANALWPLQPVTALVYVVAPIPSPLALTIAGIPLSSQAAARDALIERLREDATPGGTVKINRLWEAVQVALGDSSFDINAPLDDVSAPPGHMLTLGVITFV